MKHDLTAYSVFLSGELNPLSHTEFDKSALKAEKRFSKQIESYLESHMVSIRKKIQEIDKPSEYIETLLSNLDMLDLGFAIDDEIRIEIQTTDEDEIEVVLASKAKGKFPSLDSKKTKFFEAKRKELRNAVKAHLTETTLNFETEDKLIVYINQQHQFGLSILEKLYQRRNLIGTFAKTPFTQTKEKPDETNSALLSFIISDLCHVIRFVEERYANYLNITPLNLREFEKALYAEDKKKSGWKKWFKLDHFELKPNIIGLGVNLNEILKTAKNKKA